MAQSPTETYDLAIIGAGPGGYVAAIRAAQLGLHVAVVERRDTFGGTCLNVGCIPSKALLDSSERYHAIGDRGLQSHGITVGDVSLDIGAMMQRKQKVVDQLTGGVAALLKRNGVDTYHATARLKGSGTVEITDEAPVKYVLINDSTETSLFRSASSWQRIFVIATTDTD